MNSESKSASRCAWLLPFAGWFTAVNKGSIRPDFEAGFISAILILPQAIALATLAGMPPEYGIYTSIIPVVIASLWGSSRHTLSGPNTAVCVLIAFSVAPFASAGTEYYIGYVLALTFMVGVIQLLTGVLKLGVVLDFISHTVILAIILAVALVIIVSAASAFLGVLSNIGEPFFIRVYQVVHDIPRANGFAVIVGTATVVTGLIVRRLTRRYALIIAVITGTLCSVILNLLYGPANTGLELLGNLSLSLLPLSTPLFDLESAYVIKGLVTSALAIAFLGLMQTVVISRAIAIKSGQHIDTNQEIIGQGLSNLAAPFFSSFASSGSFNRSAAHYDAGAKTPMASVYASLILGIIAIAGTPVIAHLPMAAVAGALILVGYGLIDLRDIKQVLHSKQETVIYLITFITALTFGLNAGVFTGLFLSLVIYMWYAATPNIRVSEYTARNGCPVQSITIDGNLFFGSVRHVEKTLEELSSQREDASILLLNTDHLTYLDTSGAHLLAAEALRRQNAGGEIYISISHRDITNVLKKAGVFDAIGEDHIIRKERNHPMKDVLYPYRTSKNNFGAILSKRPATGGNMSSEALAKKILTTRLFGPLNLEQLTSLLERTPLQTAPAGDIIIKAGKPPENHLLLLEGEVEVQRTWSVPGSENDKSYTWTLKSYDGEVDFGFLSAASNRLQARAVSDIRYLLIDANIVDDMVGWNQQFADLYKDDPLLRHRINLAMQTSLFNKLPLEHFKSAFERLSSREVEAGEIIMSQGDEGDAYYIIEEGEAEIVRIDPLTDKVQRTLLLGAGDAVGEEALLQGGFRNATVTMTTPGKLLVLMKPDFDEFVNRVL